MRLHLVFTFSLLTFFSFAQVNPTVQVAARAQLAQKGISEEEMRAKLLQKGINIDQVTPEQLPALQASIEQAVKEIEAEKALKMRGQPMPVITTGRGAPSTAKEEVKQAAKEEVSKVAAKSGMEVQQRVKEGATVEEAVAETLNKQAKSDTMPKSGIWGQQIFRNKSLEVYRTTKDAKPSESYLLGVGDELTVTIFGPSQGDFRYTIDEEGSISPQGVGKIFLKGVPYGKAKSLIRSRFSRSFLFREDQFIMSLATARTISVSVFGEAQNYGSFTLSAVNTAFNAIAAAGGPSDIGSVRNIKLMRNGKTRTLDVYAFMTNPSIQYDFFLENNDLISIPVADRLISISGAINRPMTYELLPSENLQKLIEFAAGYRSNAYKNLLQVRRTIGDKPTLIDVDISKTPNFSLINGDQVFIKTLPEEAENYATISGDVEFVGKYSLKETPELGLLVQKANFKRTARTDLAFILRRMENGNVKVISVNPEEAIKDPTKKVPLQALDQVLIYTQERYNDVMTVGVEGAVRDAKPQPFNAGMKLSDLLLLSGGLKDDATEFGYVLRQDTADKTKEYVRIDPKAALKNLASLDNILLRGNDRVHIYSKKEFLTEGVVRVSGAVRKGGTFPFGKTFTLKDVLLMSGGLNLEAARGRIEIFRLDFSDNTTIRRLAQTLTVQDDLGTTGADVALQPYDEIVVRTVPEFSMQRMVRLEGEVKYPGNYALLTPDERIGDVIKRAGGLGREAFTEGTTIFRTDANVGYIVTKVEEVMRDPSSRYNIILREGDVVTIPKSKDLVSIYTANTNVQESLNELLNTQEKVNVAFEPGKSAGWYVKEFMAGPDRYSSYRKIKVQYPNGHVKRSLNLGLFVITPKVMKGSTILLTPNKVPKKDEAPKPPSKPVDWDKAFTQVLTFVSALATILIAASAIKKL